jgi:UDP-N-acetylmuramoylalanine--D-glutamate ligase
MGLGLNGGGLATAKFLLSRGAVVTVTDMKDASAFVGPVNELTAFAAARGYPPVRFVLGRHEMADFEKADMVLKNPIVHPDSPYLLASKRVETDMGLFLAENPARLTAVTGSKGKSTTAAAVHYALEKYHGQTSRGKAYLGGNITVSPLSFLDDLTEDDDVVLELSSWQLGDLRGKTAGAAPLLKPRVAVLTAIMPDHQNWYHGMEPYVADKCVIYQQQDENDTTVTLDDVWGRRFLAETRAKKVSIADTPAELRSLVPHIPGSHNKQNLALAGLALAELGLPLPFIADSLEQYPGIEHRLEFFHTYNGVRYYNDSAATVPEAAASALAALPGSVFVTGGTDKELDFAPLASALADSCCQVRAVILLSGSGTDKLIPLLAQNDIAYQGPFDRLDDAVQAAVAAACPGHAVLFSPGCTSFGMFTNEFDRGRQFKASVKKRTEQTASPQILTDDVG